MSLNDMVKVNASCGDASRGGTSPYSNIAAPTVENNRLRYGSPQPANSVKWLEPVPDNGSFIMFDGLSVPAASLHERDDTKKSSTFAAAESDRQVEADCKEISFAKANSKEAATVSASTQCERGKVSTVNNKRRSAPRYRMVARTSASGHNTDGNNNKYTNESAFGTGGCAGKSIAEVRLQFAERVANRRSLHLGSGYGTTFSLPSVPNAQLTAMLGGAGAVRPRGGGSAYEAGSPSAAEAMHPAADGVRWATPHSSARRLRSASTRRALSAPRPARGLTPTSPTRSSTNTADHDPNSSSAAAAAIRVHVDVKGEVRIAMANTAGSDDVAAQQKNSDGATAIVQVGHQSPKAAPPTKGTTKKAASGGGPNSDADETDDEDDGDEYEVITCLAAGRHLAPFAGYATVYLSLTMIMTVLPLGFVGNQLGEEVLAGASVGYFMLCMFAVYPTMGMMYALDTLCSHEYGRDPTSDYLGLLLQRGLIVGLAFLFAVCAAFYGFIGDLLLGFYSESTQQNAKAYLRYAILFLVPLASYSAFAKFNANQQRPHVPLIATAVGVGAMIVLLFAFVSHGLEAVMLCTAASAWVQLAVIIALSYYSPITRQTLGLVRLREAIDWPETKAYLRIAVPAAVFVAAETAAFDLSILLATAVSEAAGSAWSALLSYELVFVCVGGGFSAAACAKVGAAIGANQPINAKTYAWTALAMSMFVAIFVNAPFIYLCFDFLITTFGGNLHEAKKLQLLFPFLYIIDTIQFTFQGIFGGASLNDLGAQLLLSCLWCVGVPISVFLSMGGWDAVVRLFGSINITYPLWGTVFLPRDGEALHHHNSTATSGLDAGNVGAHFFWGWFAWVGTLVRSLDGIVGVAVGIFVGISILGPTMIFCLTRVDWDGLALAAQEDEEEAGAGGGPNAAPKKKPANREAVEDDKYSCSEEDDEEEGESDSDASDRRVRETSPPSRE